MLNRLIRYYKKYGFSSLIWRIIRELRNIIPSSSYNRQAKKKATIINGDDNISGRNSIPFHRPLFSIVVPAYNTPPRYLRELIDSIKSQSYENWELIIADGNSPKSEGKLLLKGMSEQDTRIHPLFLTENGGISKNTNAAIEQAKGEYIVFADHDDLLTPDALSELLEAFQKTGADFIYSDEDKIDENSHRVFEPHFKPDYSYDYLLCTNYMCHISAIKRVCLEKTGLLNEVFDGSQDHDLNLRATENNLKIVHIPKVLYHWRAFHKSVSHSSITKCTDAAAEAVQKHLDRLSIQATVEKQNLGNRVKYRIIGNPLVSIIPVGKSVSGIEPCDTNQLRELTKYKNIEFPPSAKDAKGVFIVFIRNDAIPDESDWLDELISYVQQKGVTAASGKVLDRRNRITNTGLFFVDGYLRYSYYNSFVAEQGYFLKNTCVYNMSAVYPEFCIVKADEYKAFISENSDGDIIEFCLQADGRKIFVPYALAHLSTRNPKKPSECLKKYNTPFQEDPFFNVNLSRVRTDWSLKPFHSN